MCGILGHFSNQKTFNQKIKNSLGYIKPRGPDHIGEYKKKLKFWQLEIWHTRLAILDLSKRGHQPIENPDTPWVLAYNGEIYNYLEIKKELQQLGWTFESQSDTEVLLKTWTQWGLEGLNRLNGMFAFAAFHKKTNELWLVRDRFGVKPLHWGYSKNKSALVFSSSLAAVATSLDAVIDIDNCALGLRYLMYEAEPQMSTFKGVQSVKPGGWLKVRFENDTLSSSCGAWYNLKNAVEKKTYQIYQIKDSDLLNKCQQILFDAVNVRLRSDVPLAVSLSGGLDSSSVSGIAAKLVKNIHGFNYGSPFANKSEGPMVKLFTKQNGIKTHYIWPNANSNYLDSLLEATLIAQEAPFSGLSVMAQNEIFKSAQKAGFKVILGGQAGDEIFAGYRKFFLVAIRSAIFDHKVLETFQLIYSLGRMMLHEVFSCSIYLQNIDRYHSRKKCPFRLINWEVPALDLLGSSSENLQFRQIKDIEKWSIPSLLRYEDRNSMAHGVESRLPFMDYRLVELAIALPVRLKIKNGFGKWTLREITKEFVPSFIRLNRKKRGFDVVQTWIESGLGQSLRTRIKENYLNLKTYLKSGLNLDRDLSNENLKRNSMLLREALMLCWLCQPIRQPKKPVYKI